MPGPWSLIASSTAPAAVCRDTSILPSVSPYLIALSSKLDSSFYDAHPKAEPCAVVCRVAPSPLLLKLHELLQEVEVDMTLF